MALALLVRDALLAISLGVASQFPYAVFLLSAGAWTLGIGRCETPERRCAGDAAATPGGVGLIMSEIELSAGTIEYEDTGGAGPTIVLLHGFMMDASLWDEVIDDLSVDHRCVAPTLPLGAHRRPPHPDADASLRGVARLVAEFLDRLDLRDVTLVGNDTGAALVQLVQTPP